MSATEATTQPPNDQANESIDSTTKEVIVEIKNAPVSSQVKLIGLFKLLADIKAADKSFAVNSSKHDYDAHVQTQALFNQAVQVYKNEVAFTKNSIKDPSIFFSAEELADPEFEKFESVAPVHPWFNLLTKIDIINTYITEADEEILKHLTKIDVIRHPDSDDFEVEFSFEPNAFFTNDKLRVEAICDDDDENGEPIEEIKSTEIQWKEGKDPRHEEKKTKAKTKKGKKIPGKVKLERTDSFFWLFKDHAKHSQEEEEEDDEDGQGGDPLSDSGLYHQAADIMELLKKSAFTYAIPAMFNIKVEEFTGLGDMDDEALEGVQQQIQAGQKPECKQQ